MKDEAPDAWAKLIDQLLASPRYGDAGAGYWLDVARYADTKGYVFRRNGIFPFSYTYRDYVIRSFNEDKPYDRFVTEQIAADLLPPATTAGRSRRWVSHARPPVPQQPCTDIIDDRIDVVTRGLMGLTVACARCHDHKYDPIPADDYYSLYGVFASSNEPAELPLIGEVKRTPEVIAFETDLEKREADYRAEIAKHHTATLKKLRESTSVADYLRAVLDAREAERGSTEPRAATRPDAVRLRPLRAPISKPSGRPSRRCTCRCSPLRRSRRRASRRRYTMPSARTRTRSSRRR